MSTSVADFLLELRCEEIPARMQARAKEDLARLFAEAMTSAGIAADSIECFATPRRLALIAKGLPLATEAVSEETKGPKVGAPPQAMEGFLRKVGLREEQLIVRDGVYFAVVEKPGRKTADVLAAAIPALIRAFPWPKSMRWGAASISTESLRWVRPLQGIIALLGDAVVDCEIDGIVSGRTTMGHRFHSSGPVEISNAASYVEQLRAAHVIVHFSERCALIRDGAARAAADAGLVLVEDEGLVAENAGLTEWPVPMLGHFDPAFLAVPEEVIQLTARVNQKYFVCHDKAGKLANAFICTANIVANDGGAAIVAGNEKVLAARLSDAKFFWEQDLKIPLDEQAKKLSQITFHKHLGTVSDKVERVAQIARWLVEQGIVKGASADQVERAVRLAKADLVTGMVGEFPELQGLMGGYYARAQGEADAVADAVRDHYKPVGQGDDVPTAPVTVAVSLADKLDTLVGFFAIDERPTGSKDPFALRRAAIGILSIMIAKSLNINLTAVLRNAVDHLAKQFLLRVRQIQPAAFEYLARNAGRQPRQSMARVDGFEPHVKPTAAVWAVLAARIASTEGIIVAHLLDFFADRLKVQQREAGVRHDLIDAVFALGGEDDLVRLLARVKALQSFITTQEGANLLAGYKRAANLLKQAEGVDADAAAPSDLGGEEQALLAALDAAEPKAAAAIEAERFEDAMAALASLRAPIDAFFDGVMVNDPDPEKRAFRLGLLTRFRDAVHRVADFSRIEG